MHRILTPPVHVWGRKHNCPSFAVRCSLGTNHNPESTNICPAYSRILFWLFSVGNVRCLSRRPRLVASVSHVYCIAVDAFVRCCRTRYVRLSDAE